MIEVGVRLSQFSFLIFFLGLAVALTQAQHISTALRDQYLAKTLLLRDYYSGSDLEYDHDGKLVRGGAPAPWTRATIKISELTVIRDAAEIEGTRFGTVYIGGKPSLVKLGLIRMRIAAVGENTDGIRTALERIFVQPGESLEESAPECWKVFLGRDDTQTNWANFLKAKRLTPYNTQLKPNDAPIGKLTAPQVLYQPDPDYPQAAPHDIKGRVLLRIIIDRNGEPTAISVLEPLGLGFDEQAVLAVRRWRFKPSTLNGEPVPVQINVDVAFNPVAFHP